MPLSGLSHNAAATIDSKMNGSKGVNSDTHSWRSYSAPKAPQGQPSRSAIGNTKNGKRKKINNNPKRIKRQKQALCLTPRLMMMNQLYGVGAVIKS